MRKREDIESDCESHDLEGLIGVIVEIVLDIRELLQRRKGK